MAVLEVTAFQFGMSKITKLTVLLDDLETKDKQITVIGQIIDLHMSSHRTPFWEWTKDYVALDVGSENGMLTHRQFVLEIPSFLVQTLAPTILIKSASLDTTDTTWKLASDNLQAVVDSLWESLEPNTEKIFGHVESLPSINNPSCLPYCDTTGTEALHLEQIPEGVIPKPKLDSKKPVECCLCNETIVLNKMCNHVGTHILHSLCGTSDPKPCSKQAIGENPCGFCGLEGCLTQLQEKKKGSLSVASNCLYYYVAMNYKAAVKFSKAIPCTNVRVHCPLCPTSVSEQPQTI